MAKHNELGKQGEKAAVEYLKKEGYTILDLNWRFNRKEVDIIARKEEFIVFVEVKTRSTTCYGAPEESVTLQKQKYLITAADAYLQRFDFEVEARFDVISIIQKRESFSLNHIKEAFIPLLD